MPREVDEQQSAFLQMESQDVEHLVKNGKKKTVCNMLSKQEIEIAPFKSTDTSIKGKFPILVIHGAVLLTSVFFSCLTFCIGSGVCAIEGQTSFVQLKQSTKEIMICHN